MVGSVFDFGSFVLGSVEVEVNLGLVSRVNHQTKYPVRVHEHGALMMREDVNKQEQTRAHMLHLLGVVTHLG